MTAEILQEHEIIWKKKPVLRAIYHSYYQKIVRFTKTGTTLEIGGGTGNLKQYLANVISTDIVKTPMLDATCDAHALPFKDESFDNIIAVDALHHFESPIRFFHEAQRILRKGGRIILLDPAITLISHPFYHFFHPEPVITTVNPLTNTTLSSNRKPFDSNQAIPELMFGKYKKDFLANFPEFFILTKQYLSLWAYPLSGGFRKWSLIPSFCVRGLLKIESVIEKFIGKYLGFRIFVVIEKKKHL